MTTFKIPTTLQDQSEVLVTGIKRIVLNSGREGVCLRLIIHGTTIATNAMLQRKGAKVALLATKGFEG